ncbi:hypothetical protein [Nocardia amikacinitolerans]|uniref:hypothetical protein n=1 Tax=Nocardia amikacinitolerans TaxID=756689 RepID=UPI0020A29341|nr:hypothetical protein [Nocardia amikacinitolerans]MCP2276552.1 hypothetical protein [Nocardia amikacinitolerans]
MNAVLVREHADGLWTVVPSGAPTVLDDAPALDTLVLEVIGGHLSWSLSADEHVPAAVLHDLDDAQEWLWAVYGERVALAVADKRTGELPADPALPTLVTRARRLAYAHWAARWWPASTIDGIPALDQSLLDTEIATLTEECESLVDGVDANLEPMTAPSAALGRAEDYALAAGPGARHGELVLGRGSGGWDWRRCPPGLVDASERAVSWELTRAEGATLVRVRAVAAPQLVAAPAHLRPRALLDTAGGAVDTELELFGDTWQGVASVWSDEVASVRVYVPGVGPAELNAAEREERQRIRDFAVARLGRAAAGDDDLLLAEIAAAAMDSDF